MVFLALLGPCPVCDFMRVSFSLNVGVSISSYQFHIVKLETHQWKHIVCVLCHRMVTCPSVHFLSSPCVGLEKLQQTHWG